MQLDILQLYQQARREALSPKELAWLEAETEKFPYCALPVAILARQHARTEDPRQARTLLTGAALSSNRLLFQKYMMEESAAPVKEPQE